MRGNSKDVRSQPNNRYSTNISSVRGCVGRRIIGARGATGVGGILTSSKHRFLSLNRWTDFRGLFLGLRNFLNPVEPLLVRLEEGNEARVGIEPTNTAFAEPCLTTWLPRHGVPFFIQSNAGYDN